MPTSSQLRLIHVAARQVNLIDGDGDAAYRLLLRNVADVESARDLSQSDFEDVMAVIEDEGFRMPGLDPEYWRSKVARRGTFAGERMVHKIHSLAAACTRYPLEALCRQFSDNRTSEPTKLRPKEAWRLIEMLKAAATREGQRPALAARPSNP